MDWWVDVNHALPDVGDKVLAYDGYDIYLAWMSKEDKEIWIYSDCCGCATGKITHWMLPPAKPPR